MAGSDDLRRMALSLTGTLEAPHFDRVAFKAARIYATMPADGLTANLKLTPEEQEFRCMVKPEAFAPVPNAWGRQGWTSVRLDALDADELGQVLEAAWREAQPRTRRRREPAGLRRRPASPPR